MLFHSNLRKEATGNNRKIELSDGWYLDKWEKEEYEERGKGGVQRKRKRRG